MSIKGDIFKRQVNSIVGMVFVGSFALWTGVIIWQTAHHENPIAKAFEQYYPAERP